jgi:hypothetical protein
VTRRINNHHSSLSTTRWDRLDHTVSSFITSLRAEITLQPHSLSPYEHPFISPFKPPPRLSPSQPSAVQTAAARPTRKPLAPVNCDGCCDPLRSVIGIPVTSPNAARSLPLKQKKLTHWPPSVTAMPQCSSPLLLRPRPNSSSSSFSSKPSLPTTPATELSFSSTHLLPYFLQDVVCSFAQDPDAKSYSIDMAQCHPVQSELHPLHAYFERWQALKQYSDSKDDLIQVRAMVPDLTASAMMQLSLHQP